MYHGVMDTDRGQALVNVNQVGAASFRWQLEFLREHYTVVSLEDIVRRIKRADPIDGLAAITFDDGYLSVFENAAPILRSLELPSTVFLIAGCIEQNCLTWYDRVEAHVLHTSLQKIALEGVSYQLESDRGGAVRAIMSRLKTLGLEERDRIIAELVATAGPLTLEQSSPYRLMGWNQIRELQSQGMSFGVHTYSHPHLSKVTGDLQLEINDAAALVSKRLSIPLQDLIFCYPDGDYNKVVRDRVEASGMCGAVAVKNALTPPDSDPFALPRVAVGRAHSQAMFCDATVGFTLRVKSFLTF